MSTSIHFKFWVLENFIVRDKISTTYCRIDKLKINNGEIFNSLSFTESSFDNISISNGSIGTVSFIIGHVDTLWIQNIELKENISFQDYDVEKITINNFKGRFSIGDLDSSIAKKINSISINDLLSTSSVIILSNLILGSFVMKNIDESNQLNFVKLKIAQSNFNLQFENILFSNTRIFDCNFESAKNCLIKNCDLSVIKTVENVRWPLNINSSNPLSERETYKQLKKLMISHNDKIHAIEYYQKEMEAFNRSQNFWRDLPDSFIVWCGKSNCYGTSFIKPVILLLFFFGQLFFLPMAIITNLDLNLNTYLAKYFEFLNPIHKIDFLNNLSASIVILDFIGRIVISFFIYQTIVAFRKYNYKS